MKQLKMSLIYLLIIWIAYENIPDKKKGTIVTLFRSGYGADDFQIPPHQFGAVVRHN